jgi:hypothetical protein
VTIFGRTPARAIQISNTKIGFFLPNIFRGSVFQVFSQFSVPLSVPPWLSTQTHHMVLRRMSGKGRISSEPQEETDRKETMTTSSSASDIAASAATGKSLIIVDCLPLMTSSSPTSSEGGSSNITSEDMEQLITDLQDVAGDTDSEESHLLYPTSEPSQVAGFDLNQSSSELSAPSSRPAKTLVKERENYFLTPTEDDEEIDVAGNSSAPWLDLACFTDSTDVPSESEDDDAASIRQEKEEFSAREVRPPRAKRAKKAYPQVPVRASKRLRNNGEGKWLEERAVTHIVLSPYDA